MAEVLTPARQAGAPGYSAYQLAVQAGYAGTQAQWLTSLVGPPADTTALTAATAAAQSSATGASGSASAAFGSMQAAAASATAANSSATTAAASVTAAGAQAANAASSAAAAGASATAAAGSATAAAGSVTTAQAWAMQMSGTVDGTNYSSKYWAGQAQQSAAAAALSASQAAGAGVAPQGSFVVGHVFVANDTAGKTAIDGGALATVARSGLASDLGGTLAAAQLPTGGVANSNLANMAAGTVKANLTGAAAGPSDATPSALLDSFGSTRGSVIYRGASAWAALGPGSAGQVLASGGASANPAWAAAAPIFPVTGVTAAKTAAFTLGAGAGEIAGTLYPLSGSFAGTVPAASGGSAASPLWYHLSKRDGSGACTLALSGSDTWDDGTTTPKFVYQETGTLLSLGGGVWRFAPGTRQRGRVFAGTSTIPANAASFTVSLGFGDPDAQNVVVEAAGLMLSASGNVAYSLTQGGSAATLAGTANLTVTNSTGPHAGSILVRNVRATPANAVSVQALGLAGTGSYSNGVQVTSSGAVANLVVTPTASFTGGASGGTYSVWVERG